MRSMVLCIVLVALLATPAAAATLEVSSFGDEGWMSDDTRSATGADLVGLNYTHYGKPGQTPTVADDAAIAQQIQFIYAGPDNVSCLKMAKVSQSGGYSKCTLSKIEEAGLAPASDLTANGFSANYRYYTESTAEATILKLGIRSTLWGTGAGQSQNGFTALKSGESAWDLILVDWRGTNPPWTVGAWDTFVTDKDTDCWMVYRQGGNSFFNAPPAGPKTLAEWAAETSIACTIAGTPYTWAQVLFGTGASVSSIQFGVGSSSQTSNTYIDWIETSLLNGGERVEFDGPPPPVHNVTQGLYYATIQGAVDAADPGDEIEVAAGIYEEQVEIDSPLTLVGAGAGQTIVRAPAVLPLYFLTSGTTQNHPVIYVHDTDGAALQDLTVDGYGRGNGNYRFSGIAYFNAGGTITGCDVVDVRETPLSGTQHGVAIYAYAPSAPVRTLDIDGCAISGYQKNGMAMLGSQLTASVDGCTVTGAGPLGLGLPAQNGIQFGLGAAGSIGATAGNTISGHAYTPHTWAACGILVMETAGTLVIANNAVDENTEGIYIWNASADITDNVVTATTAGSSVADYTGMILDPGNGAKPVQAVDAEGSRAKDRSSFAFNLAGNVVTGDGGANSVGVLLYSEAGKNVTYAAQNEIVSGFEYGILADEDEAGLITAMAITGSSIYGNTGYGVYNDAATEFDADDNWWGDATGPFHPVDNAGGLGNEVSDNVSFDPYRTGNVVCMPDPQEISLADPIVGGARADDVTVRYLGGGSGLLFGFSIKIEFDPTKIDVHSITRPATGPFAGAAIFQVVGPPLLPAGTRIVDVALPGGHPGTAGPEDLFVILFKGLDCTQPAVPNVDLTILNARDAANQALSGFVADDGLVKVDLGAPSVSAGMLVRTNLPNTGYVKGLDAVTLTATVNDACGSVGAITADLSALGLGAAVPPTTWAAPTATWSDLVVGISDPLQDGWKDLSVTASDLLGNAATVVFDDIVYLDNTKPAGPTAFAAAPAHNEVGLAWTNPAGDPSLDNYGIMLRRADWDGASPPTQDDYPEYTGTGPAYPDSAEGSRILHAPGMVDSFFDVFLADGTERDIYAYQGYIFDKAYNYSVAAAGARDRATNYWLGDVAPPAGPLGNGEVTFQDVNALAYSYYVPEGGASWNSHCDVGPTDDGSRTGIPLPDNQVQFEDLMIFAMNYGVVTPLASGTPALEVAATPVLELRTDPTGPSGTFTARLRLSGNESSVKGIHTRVSYNTQRLQLVSVERGALAVPEGIFFASVPQSGSVIVDAAQLGEGLALEGSGEIAILTFRARGVAAPPVLAVAEIRDAQNRLLGTPIGVESKPGLPRESVEAAEPRVPETVGRIPSAFELESVRPNPFTDRLEIRFGLPSEEMVQVRIYDVGGRLVRALGGDVRAAGEHVVTWDGRTAQGDPARAGIYFATIQAGAQQFTRKVFLAR